MPSTIATNTGAQATGAPAQSHIVYGVNSALWWAFAYTSTQTLQSYSSPDLATWTARDTLTLAFAHASEGRNLAVHYRNIASTDVVHIANSYANGTTSMVSYHVRATLSSTPACTFGTEAQVGVSGTYSSGNKPDGPGVGFDSSNNVYHITGYDLASTDGNPAAAKSTNADAGTSWTAGFGTPFEFESVTVFTQSSQLLDLGSGNVLALYDNGSTASVTQTNIRWSKWNGSAWSTSADVFGTALTTADGDYTWHAVARTTSDIHCVRRNGASGFDHVRFNGTAWSAGNTIPTLATIASGTLFLATDGTNVWLFAIGSATGNALSYVKWTASSTSWDASWTSLVSTSATRNYLSGYPKAGSNQLALIWVEGTASPYNLVTTSLSLGLTAGWSIERKQDAGSYAEIVQVADGTSTYADAGPFSNGSTYYYRVRHFANGLFGPYSNVAPVSFGNDKMPASATARAVFVSRKTATVLVILEGASHVAVTNTTSRTGTERGSVAARSTATSSKATSGKVPASSTAEALAQTAKGGTNSTTASAAARAATPGTKGALGATRSSAAAKSSTTATKGGTGIATASGTGRAVSTASTARAGAARASSASRGIYATAKAAFSVGLAKAASQATLSGSQALTLFANLVASAASRAVFGSSKGTSGTVKGSASGRGIFATAKAAVSSGVSSAAASATMLGSQLTTIFGSVVGSVAGRASLGGVKNALGSTRASVAARAVAPTAKNALALAAASLAARSQSTAQKGALARALASAGSRTLGSGVKGALGQARASVGSRGSALGSKLTSSIVKASGALSGALATVIGTPADGSKLVYPLFTTLYDTGRRFVSLFSDGSKNTDGDNGRKNTG